MKFVNWDGNPWDARFFMVAGCFMLINTAMLWIRLCSGYQLSLLWPAIPAITGLAFGVFALLKLYPRIAPRAHSIAKVGAGFALLAAGSLAIAALWIGVSAVFGDGMPQQSSPWFLSLTAVFILATILAFLTNSIAFIQDSAQRIVGYLLAVPVAMWSLILAVGLVKGMEAGLSLDFYTNGVIGLAFLALGYALIKKGEA